MRLRINEAEIFFVDEGVGQPVVFIHGLALSGRVFDLQLEELKRNYRLVMPDLRGQGRSPRIDSGHTIAQYARDTAGLIEQLELKNVILVGWSMGALVVWDYLKQFGTPNTRGTIIIAEPPAELNDGEWTLGSMDFSGLIEAMNAVQTNFGELLPEFTTSLFGKTVDSKLFHKLLTVRSSATKFSA